MRTVFMGTPEFAVPCLEILAQMCDVELCGVFTQPDRPKGRGQKSASSPVKLKALELDINVFQPTSGCDDDFIEVLISLKPDLVVVVAYGLLLPAKALYLPAHGCINVHASLLPSYRGAAPIQQCIIDRCQETGITTMLMDEGLDTGDMIIQKRVTLVPDETAATLHDKLSVLGAETLKETIERIQEGTVTFTPQNHRLATYAPRLNKETGRINWNKTAMEIDAFIRGVQPWPTAFTELDGKIMKVWGAEALVEKHNVTPGVIIDVNNEGIKVAAADGVLFIKEIQMEGKKRMKVIDYIKGNQVVAGNRLGA